MYDKCREVALNIGLRSLVEWVHRAASHVLQTPQTWGIQPAPKIRAGSRRSLSLPPSAVFPGVLDDPL